MLRLSRSRRQYPSFQSRPATLARRHPGRLRSALAAPFHATAALAKASGQGLRSWIVFVVSTRQNLQSFGFTAHYTNGLQMGSRLLLHRRCRCYHCPQSILAGCGRLMERSVSRLPVAGRCASSASNAAGTLRASGVPWRVWHELPIIMRAESREPRAESREPRAESREPRAESREPRAESREPRAMASFVFPVAGAHRAPADGAMAGRVQPGA